MNYLLLLLPTLLFSFCVAQNSTKQTGSNGFVPSPSPASTPVASPSPFNPLGGSTSPYSFPSTSPGGLLGGGGGTGQIVSVPITFINMMRTDNDRPRFTNCLSVRVNNAPALQVGCNQEANRTTQIQLLAPPSVNNIGLDFSSSGGAVISTSIPGKIALSRPARSAVYISQESVDRLRFYLNDNNDSDDDDFASAITGLNQVKYRIENTNIQN